MAKASAANGDGMSGSARSNALSARKRWARARLAALRRTGVSLRTMRLCAVGLSGPVHHRHPACVIAALRSIKVTSIVICV